jgi:hypothetical protein
VGTNGLIVATITAGVLWESGRSWPFASFVVGAGTSLVLELDILGMGRARVLHPVAI